MSNQLTDVERLMLHARGSIPRMLVVVAGPSGVGKNTIIKEVLTNHSDIMARLITYTTRPRRDDEVEGEQYRFVSPQLFSELATQGRLMEANAESAGHDVYKLGHVYSMPADIYDGVPLNKHILIAEVDIHGMRRLREHYPDCITIFVSAPPDALRERIMERRDEHMNDDNLAHRLETAREQMQAAREFDYIVFNEEGHLYRTVGAIETILSAERMRIREADKIDLLASLSGEALSDARS
jgi:guanylate kinase